MKRLKLAGIGCGVRTLTYMELAAQMPTRYEVVAGADPLAQRVERARKASCNPDFRGFVDDAAILAEDKLADVMIIGTQDAYHVQPARAAMEKGYDLLLEKPIATDAAQVIELAGIAKKLGRRVVVCHVLRYAPFYQKVRELIDSGILGDIVSVNATEGVGAWHQAHSYVRGHWAVTEKCNPMIIAKSCHDMDVISWLVGRPCRSVSSHGSLMHFTEANAPEGAPARCTDGCPVGPTCHYNALRYASSRRAWLRNVYDDDAGADLEQIRQWLSHSPWGRCVYRCANTAVDHQVVGMEFEGGATATFTMSAFAGGARQLEIFGTKARLHGGGFAREAGGAEIFVMQHDGGDMTRYNVSASIGGYVGHGGGDPGLVLALYDEMMRPNPDDMLTAIAESIESHVIGFAAEESRLTGQTVDVAEYRTRCGE